MFLFIIFFFYVGQLFSLTKVHKKFRLARSYSIFLWQQYSKKLHWSILAGYLTEQCFELFPVLAPSLNMQKVCLVCKRCVIWFKNQITTKSDKFQFFKGKKRQNYFVLHVNYLYQKNNSVPSVVWVLRGFFT